ncbi:MAG: thioredoxin domain-containing protein [Patescibacteria group bacterium]
MKNPWIIIGVLVVVLFGGAFWYSGSVAEQANEGIEIAKNIKGNTESTVILEEFSDFQCPACGQFYPVVQDIMDDYGDQIQFHYRHFPLIRIHPAAEPAARAAEAAGQQGKFFEYHDLLFENQPAWSQSANPSAFFTRFAEELELDMNQFTSQQRSSLIRDKIRDDMAEGMERGVNSTPTFFLNGERLQLTTIGDLRAAVEAALGVVPEGAEVPAETTTVDPNENVQFGI